MTGGRRGAWAPCLAMLVCLGGCDDAGGDAPMADAAVEPPCDVELLFLQRCGGGPCHEGDNAAAGLDLVIDGLEARVSLVPALQCGGLLADPSDPTNSVIYQKILPRPTCGGPMPVTGEKLTEAEAKCVRDWISGLRPPGAPDVDRGPIPDGGVRPRDMGTPGCPGCVCEAGTTEACYGAPEATRGIGVCVAGERTCAADGRSFGPCEGAVLPGPEDCHTPEDENCDGVTPACSPAWSFGFGDDGPQSVRSVAADADGNVYLLGDFEGAFDFGGGLLRATGDKADIVLASYDPLGAHRWSKRFGDSSNQYATQVAVGPTGQVVILGRAFGKIDFGGTLLDAAGTDDVFVAAFGPDGQHRWSRIFGGIDPDRAERLAFEANGDVLVTGAFTGTVDFGAGPVRSAGQRDAFVLRLAGANGAHLGSLAIGGPGDEYGFGIAAAPGGDLYVTGRFQESVSVAGGPMLRSAGGRDVYLARITRAGGHVWSRAIGGAEDDLVFDLVPSPAGDGLAITGYVVGEVDFGDGPRATIGGQDLFLARYDADGALRWANVYGDAGDQFAIDFDTNSWNALAWAPGRLVVAGGFSGTLAGEGAQALTSAGRTDAFALVVDGDGAWINGWRFGTANTEIALDVALAPADRVVLGGRIFGTRGMDFGGSGSVPSAGSSDGFVVQIAP